MNLEKIEERDSTFRNRKDEIKDFKKELESYKHLIREELERNEE